MAEEFQLEGLLGLGLPPGPPPPLAVPVVREIRVDERVLEALINQASALIQADTSFRKKLSEKLGSEDMAVLKPHLEAAAKKAAAELRATVSNVVVQGFWPLAEAVLRAVVIGELTVVAAEKAFELQASPEQSLRVIGEALRGAGLAGETAEFTRLSNLVLQFPFLRQATLEVFAQELFRRKSPVQAAKIAYAYAQARVGEEKREESRRQILQLCMSLVTQGRLHRFELMELDNLLRDIHSQVLPRQRVLASIDRLVARLAAGRIRELRAPLGGAEDVPSNTA